MTKDDVKNLFKDFLPAILAYGCQDIEEDRLLDCWIKHVDGQPYSLPDGIHDTVMIYPKHQAQL